MPDALSNISTRRPRTPQNVQADPREVKNAAGGYVFQVGDDAHLHRFLTLGTEGGTFYTSPEKLTREAAGTVIKMAQASDARLLEAIRDVSVGGKAPRQNPALFALAVAASLGDTDYRLAALNSLDGVARTGTHLFQFIGYAEQFRGWGTAFSRAVAEWYTGKTVQDAAYQMLKYKSRYGWSHRDVLRLAHVRSKRKDAEIGQVQNDLFRYFARGEAEPTRNLCTTVPLVEAAHRMHQTRDVGEWVRIIKSNRSLSWEMIPSEALAEAAVWEALLFNGNMPIGAILRQIPTMTSVGLLSPMSGAIGYITDHLTSEHVLKAGRIHPVQMLIAAKTYAGGHSLGGGKATWTPVQQIVDAMSDGFYAAYGAVEPSGKRVMITTDTSGSMGWQIPGYPMSAAETVGAMALVTAKTEPVYSMHGFNSQIYDLPISPRMRIDDVVRKMFSMYGGSTDCAAPMLWAKQNKVPVDTFQIFTDNETWAGMAHPWEALESYRQSSGIDARLQVISIQATTHSIADPADTRQIDVSGFDSTVPKLLADHGRGDL